MRLNRLIGIITTLQQKGKVTAPYLAEKFEVSRRTIARDIEDICRAGIPIVTTQGSGGGISIMDGFTIDTTVLTEDELQAIFAGISSLDSVSNRPSNASLRDKLGGQLETMDHIVIDLASFYKGSLSEKIELLKAAISAHRQVSFRYYYNRGEEIKCIEPALIVFKWTSWYVFGYCPDRADFRMYKLNRLWELEMLDTTFQPREIPREKLQFGQHLTDDILISARFAPELKYRLVEEYGPSSFTVREDGWLDATYWFTDYDYALQWFLGWGSRVRVLSPEPFVTRYREELQKMLDALDQT